MGDIALIHQAAREIDAGRPVAMATVIATSRSVPRHVGAQMLVRADGSISGTIGGGEMEARVVSEAQTAMADGRPRTVSYSLVDPGQGDPGVCGGDVEVYVEPYLQPASMLIVGGGHVGRAVAELATWSGFNAIVWDDRAELLADIDARCVTGDIAAALHGLSFDERSIIVVVTRNAALDIEIMPTLLATPCAYIGVMGSRRRWATTRDALAALGHDDDQLSRVHNPIGMEIGAETPTEIAISIIAEVISTRGHS